MSTRTPLPTVNERDAENVSGPGVLVASWPVAPWARWAGGRPASCGDPGSTAAVAPVGCSPARRGPGPGPRGARTQLRCKRPRSSGGAVGLETRSRCRWKGADGAERTVLCASFLKLVWDGGERARAAAAGAAGAPGGARGAAARRPALASRTGLARAPRFYKRSLRFCPLHLLKKPGAAFRGNDSLRWRPRWRRAGALGARPWARDCPGPAVRSAERRESSRWRNFVALPL